MTPPLPASVLMLGSYMLESQVYHPFQSDRSSKPLSLSLMLLTEKITLRDFSCFISYLETTMKAKANSLLEIYLKPCKAWTNSALNSQEDCFIQLICSYYPGRRAKLTVSKWGLRMHKKHIKCQQKPIRHSVCIYLNFGTSRTFVNNLEREI